MAMYGYARVSTLEQSMDRQIKALEEFGVLTKNIYKDKQSGSDFARPAYKRLIRKLRGEDVLVIKSIDRLGRNYAEILEQWRVITKVKGASIVVLDMPILDTRKERFSSADNVVLRADRKGFYQATPSGRNSGGKIAWCKVWSSENSYSGKLCRNQGSVESRKNIIAASRKSVGSFVSYLFTLVSS